MQSQKDRITRADIGALGQEYAVSVETAMRVDPVKLRLIARSNPDQICFLVARTGRSGVPARAFAGFGRGK